MKKLLISLIALITVTSYSFAQNYDYKRDVGSFNEIKLTGKIEVELVKSTINEVKFSLQNIEEKDVIIENKNGSLTFKTKLTAITKDYKIYALISYRDIDELVTSGSVIAKINEKINADSFEFEAGGNSEIHIKEIEANELELKATSGGTIQLHGMVTELEAKANTGGTIYAEYLIADNVEARSDAGSIVEVAPVKRLEAKASTGGKIRYSGNPKNLSTSTSLGGVIEKY